MRQNTIRSLPKCTRSRFHLFFRGDTPGSPALPLYAVPQGEAPRERLAGGGAKIIVMSLCNVNLTR